MGTGNWPRSSNYSNSPANRHYKMEMCRSWEDLGICYDGLKCQFAHRKEDLWEVMSRSKYNYEICKPFEEPVVCMNGTQCHCVHAIGKEEDSNMRSPGDESIKAFLDEIGVPFTPIDKKEEIVMYRIVCGSRQRMRLPIFTEICPD